MVGDLAVVENWLTAVNDGDAGRLESLTDESVEIIGPRGQGVLERRVLGEWLVRSGFQARSLRWFCAGDGRVVVEQLAQWHDTASGHAQDQLLIGSELTIRGARVVRYVRHDSGVVGALASAGMDEERHLVRHRW